MWNLASWQKWHPIASFKSICWWHYCKANFLSLKPSYNPSSQILHSMFNVHTFWKEKVFLNWLDLMSSTIIYFMDFFCFSTAWGFGFLFVTIISFGSLIGAFVVPFMEKSFYKKTLMCMVSLAVGVLSGSGIFHLIPSVRFFFYVCFK